MSLDPTFLAFPTVGTRVAPTAVFGNGKCIGGALLNLCMDWRHMPELLAAGRPLPLRAGSAEEICAAFDSGHADTAG